MQSKDQGNKTDFAVWIHYTCKLIAETMLCSNYQNSSCKWKTLFLLSMRQLTTSWPTILFLLLFLCGQVFVDVVLRQGQGVVHFASHNLSVSRFHGLWDHSHSHVFHGFNSVCSHLHNFFHLYTKSQSRTFIDIIFVVDEYW